MRSCALLTMDNLEGFVTDDELLIAPLKKLDCSVTFIPWKNQSKDWNEFDVVVVRSTWDYNLHTDFFLQQLAKIEHSRAILMNSLNIIQWNLQKSYLGVLAQRGIPIVPTNFGKSISHDVIETLFNSLATDKLVIKPQIGANAHDTYMIYRSNFSQILPMLYQKFDSNPFLLQAFIPSILTMGEYSLFYFNGKYSHAITKLPKSGDFRSQEEHGAQIMPCQANKQLRIAGNNVLSALPANPLYARVDLVLHKNSYLVMEVELIEPSMYLRMDKNSAQRFAMEIVRILDGE